MSLLLSLLFLKPSSSLNLWLKYNIRQYWTPASLSPPSDWIISILKFYLMSSLTPFTLTIGRIVILMKYLHGVIHKNCISVFTLCLVKLFRLCLLSIFPTLWKFSCIQSVPKKGDASDLLNWFSVSLTLSFWKLKLFKIGLLKYVSWKPVFWRLVWTL